MWHFGVDLFLLLLYFTGVLLPELVVSIILLLTIDAGLMQETGSIPLLAGLLEHLDRFNHLAPGHERDDNDDLAWPGIMGTIPLGVFHFWGSMFLRWLTKINCSLFPVRRFLFRRPKYQKQRGSFSYSQGRSGEPQQGWWLLDNHWWKSLWHQGLPGSVINGKQYPGYDFNDQSRTV